MRIIAGTEGGRKLILTAPNVRPTADRVKEAIFGMLTPYITGARVCDLFAGSGALGLEALSRGAESAVFVDICPRSLCDVRANIDALGYGRRCSVKRADGVRYIAGAARSFDIIFMDPPYDQALIPRALGGMPAFDGIVVLEYAPGTPAPPGIIKEKRYGNTLVALMSGGLNTHD